MDHKNLNAFKTVLNNGVEFDYSQNKSRYRDLFIKVEEWANALIHAGYDVNYHPDNNYFTLLQQAVIIRNYELTEFLLKNNALVDLHKYHTPLCSPGSCTFSSFINFNLFTYINGPNSLRTFPAIRLGNDNAL